MQISQSIIRAAQIRALYKSPAAIVASGIGAFIAAIMLRGELDRALLLGWATAALGVSAARMVLWNRFRRTKPHDDAMARWTWLALAASTAIGLVWAAFALAFFLVSGEDARWVVLLIVAAVIGAGAMSNSAYLPVHYAFVVTVTLPVTIIQLWGATGIPFLLGIATVVYVGLLSAIAGAANRNMTSAIALQIKNMALIADLHLAKEAAEEASRMKSQFLSSMSHELRTPLNGIIGFSEVIAERQLGSEADRYRDCALEIAASGRRLLKLVNDVLDLSRIEAGRLDLLEDLVDPAELIETCRRLLNAQADAKAVTVTVELPQSLPLVYADEARLKQALLSLISNAVKFARTSGLVTIVARSDASGIAIAIGDDGSGTTAKEIAIALQPFRQVDGELSRGHEGSGLGLPLARALIEKHGGRLRIGSAPAIGTTVEVLLPPDRIRSRDAVAAASPGAAASPEPRARDRREGQPSALPGRALASS